MSIIHCLITLPKQSYARADPPSRILVVGPPFYLWIWSSGSYT